MDGNRVFPAAEAVLAALSRLRAPLCQGEYDLHTLVAEALREGNIPFEHERKLMQRCRIDFLAGDVGIEVKRGKPDGKTLTAQLARYAASEEVSALILVVERAAKVPSQIGGKPCHILSANKLWGIAL